jgi:hypothetical protein
MSLPACYPVTSKFRVEVSGWDKYQSFFVEKYDLECTERSGKLLSLSHAVPDGAVVFCGCCRATARNARIQCRMPTSSSEAHQTVSTAFGCTMHARVVSSRTPA